MYNNMVGHQVSKSTSNTGARPSFNGGVIRPSHGINSTNGTGMPRNSKFHSNIKNNYDPGENTRQANEQRQNSYMNGNGRPNSKVNSKAMGYLSQHKATKMVIDQPIMQTNPQREQEEADVDKYMLQQEIQKLNTQLMQMKKIIIEKDSKIKAQEGEMMNLRKKNFDFRSKNTEIIDELRKMKGREKEKEKEKQQQQNLGTPNRDEQHAKLLAIHMQHQEARQREKEIMMQVMMNSMLGGSGAEAEEERLLQRAIEESKGEAGPNPDNMTYEQLLELEANNGKVSKGLTAQQKRMIPEKTYNCKQDAEEESCSICFENFKKGQKIKKLRKCGHEYHSTCLDKWLEDEKRCPMCNEDVL